MKVLEIIGMILTGQMVLQLIRLSIPIVRKERLHTISIVLSLVFYLVMVATSPRLRCSPIKVLTPPSIRSGFTHFLSS